MNRFEVLDLLFQRQGGTVRTAQAIEAGVSKPTFYDYVKARGMEKIAHGIYASPDVWRDSMYLIHLRCKQAVFSHESALLFHDLTDREPLQYVITVKTGYNPSVLKEEGLRVYTVKEELHSVGCTTMQTPLGIPCLSMIWSGPFATCSAAAAGSRSRAFSLRSSSMRYGQIKTCGH